MVIFRTWILACLLAVTTALVSAGPSLAASEDFNHVRSRPQLAQGTVASDGFRKLTGPEIQRLFEEIGTVSFPDDGSGNNSGDWNISIQPDGSWEGASGTTNAFGVWQVEGGMQCVKCPSEDIVSRMNRLARSVS